MCSVTDKFLRLRQIGSLSISKFPNTSRFFIRTSKFQLKLDVLIFSHFFRPKCSYLCSSKKRMETKTLLDWKNLIIMFKFCYACNCYLQVTTKKNLTVNFEKKCFFNNFNISLHFSSWKSKFRLSMFLRCS